MIDILVLIILVLQLVAWNVLYVWPLRLITSPLFPPTSALLQNSSLY